jgi:L-cystine uptake protein TcyP (sodium:dicarboxylate symporter family)
MIADVTKSHKNANRKKLVRQVVALYKYIIQMFDATKLIRLFLNQSVTSYLIMYMITLIINFSSRSHLNTTFLIHARMCF